MILRCGAYSLDLTTPVVMGVLNVTPDSFSDGGRWFDASRAIEHALQMIEAGAGIIDVGGESTRPGAVAVSVAEELRRVVPVVESLVARVSVPISVDTSRAEVMRAAVNAGATIINDVRALREPNALQTAAETSAAICLMHMQGEPRSMQSAPQYSDVVSEVTEFLSGRVSACEAAGIARDRLLLDPGIGFGKRLEDNLALLANIPSLARLELPILIGVSRKSLVGTVTGRDIEHRQAGSIAFATAAVLSGASIVRVHDVAETLDAVRVAIALRQACEKP
jgi:dihydropteroate synthase